MITLTTHRDPIIPSVAAIEDKQRCINYWGARAARAEDARERMREALEKIAALPDVRADEAAGIARRTLFDPRNDRYQQ